MHKLLFTVGLVFFFASNAFSQEAVKASQGSEGWKTYESRNGYIIDYPADWKIELPGFADYIIPPGNASAAVAISAAPESILAQPSLDREKTEKDFLETCKKLPGCSLISITEDKFNNRKALVLVFNSRNPENKNSLLKNKIYRFKDDSFGIVMAWEITFKASVDSFDEYLPVAEKIIKSFRLTDNAEKKKEIKASLKSSLDEYNAFIEEQKQKQILKSKSQNRF